MLSLLSIKSFLFGVLIVNVLSATIGKNTPLQHDNEHLADDDGGGNKNRIPDEQRLLRMLFADYDYQSRPVLAMNEPVVVSIGLTIMQIFELDEKNQALITNAWVTLEWSDQYMLWEPELFGNLSTIRIPGSGLWLPDIVLYNKRAVLNNRGFIFWSIPAKLISSCKIDVTYFPFDEQLCRMKFGSWTHDGFQLDLVSTSPNVDLSVYVESGEWTLIAAKAKRNVIVYSCCIEPYPDVTFLIHIKRKTLYYFINVFFPCLIMSALTLLVFLMPAASGEKCGLGITIMLGFAVFMLSVINKLPETSESVPLITIYVAGVLSMTALSMCGTVGVLILSYKTSNSKRLPHCLRRFLAWSSPVCCLHPDMKPQQQQKKSRKLQACCMPLKSFIRQLSSEIPLVSSSLPSLLVASSTESLVVKLMQADAFYYDFTSGIDRIIDRQRQEDDEDTQKYEWSCFAEFIDRCLFWLLSSVITFFTVYLLIYTPAHHLL